MKKILIVAGDYPYPPSHGGRVDIWNRIKILKKLDYYIDLVVTSKNPEENKKYNLIVNKYVDNIYIIRRVNRIIDMLSSKPLQVESRKAIKKIIFSRVYDFIILEGDYVGEVLQNPTLQFKHALLRAHNNEIVYFKNLSKSTSNLFKKAYYYIEHMKFKKYEPILINKVKNVMFVSCDEKKDYDKKIKNIFSVFLPATVNLDFKKRELNNKTVIFIGSLFMENNKEGIIWYINKIHNKLTKSIDNYSFVIAGNSNKQSIEWLYKLTFKYKNIKIYDTPDSLDEIYASGSVFVNPMLHGAGVKLKTIEALVNGLPVVSTTIGNEGTGLVSGKDILVSDNAKEYTKYIKDLLNDNTGLKEKYIRSAQKSIKEKYDVKNILDDFLKNIKRK